MADRSSSRVPDDIHDAAADWFAKRERGRNAVTEARFERWLESDPAHRLAYREVEANWHASAPLGTTPTGQTRTLGMAPFYMRRNVQAGAGAVCLAAIIGVGLSAFPNAWPSATIVATAQAQSFETAVGKIRTVALADGSRVTLDTNSKVLVDLSQHHRNATLERGRARFAVVGRGLVPFTVRARPGTITTNGAVFDVSEGDDTSHVRVLSGEVSFRSDAISPPASTGLAAGQHATIGSPALPDANAIDDNDWPKGMIVLDATPVADAIASINRYNRVQLRLDAPDLVRVRITGGFRTNDPRGFAAAVATLHGLQVVNPGPDLIILKSRR